MYTIGGNATAGTCEQVFTTMQSQRATVGVANVAGTFSSFHISPSVNVGLFDGHVVSTTNAGSVALGCDPQVGNTSGVW